MASPQGVRVIGADDSRVCGCSSAPIETRTAKGHGDYLQMVDGFSKILEGESASRERHPGPTDEALVGAIASIVAHHLRSERLDRLEEAVPELVCLALLPYLGFDGAKGWADTADRA